MISTIGEAWDKGWTITVRCAWGKRDAMKSIRECVASVDLDLETLVWTRGRAMEAHFERRRKQKASPRLKVSNDGDIGSLTVDHPDDLTARAHTVSER